MNHMLDKAFESFFGFVHEHGSFSAYRWAALEPDYNDDGSIKNWMIDNEYLISQVNPKFQDYSYFNAAIANMTMASDIILSLEIYTKKNKAYTLKYIKNAEA
jgi:cellulose synthase/poly-beta-1,6-N-acetylglucosamine synthase-like glycosyltransferase